MAGTYIQVEGERLQKRIREIDDLIQQSDAKLANSSDQGFIQTGVVDAPVMNQQRRKQLAEERDALWKRMNELPDYEEAEIAIGTTIIGGSLEESVQTNDAENVP